MDIAEIVVQIQKMDASQVDTVLDAAMERRGILFPEWDMTYVALPKNDWDDRKQTLEYLLAIESKIREWNEIKIAKEQELL